MKGVVGRAAELTAIETILDGARPGTTALVLDGEAGIGKTTVWLAALERARENGYRVLSCRPAEGEGALPFVWLGDLLEGVSAESVRLLPERARVSLETALGRVAPTEPIEQLAVARAALELLRALADDDPLLLAIDDVQWLDPQSEEVLEFVLRRLAPRPVRVVVARRAEHDQPPPLQLDRAPDVVVTQLRLRPMLLDELRNVLSARLELTLRGAGLAGLHSACGGNPFYALEIARPLVGTDGHLADGLCRSRTVSPRCLGGAWMRSPRSRDLRSS